MTGAYGDDAYRVWNPRNYSKQTRVVFSLCELKALTILHIQLIRSNISDWTGLSLAEYVNLKHVTLSITVNDCADQYFFAEFPPSLSELNVIQTVTSKHEASAFYTKVHKDVTYAVVGEISQLCRSLSIQDVCCVRLRYLNIIRASLPSVGFVRSCPALTTLELTDVVIRSDEHMDVLGRSLVRVVLLFSYGYSFALKEPMVVLFEKFISAERIEIVTGASYERINSPVAKIYNA